MTQAGAFPDALQVLAERQASPRLTTGSPDLDLLLGGGLVPGMFYLFYGDAESGVDSLLYNVLVKTLLPAEEKGMGGEAVYLNCGNYRGEKTILDVERLSSIIKANGLDADTALDRVRVFLAFSSEHEEQVVQDVARTVAESQGVRTLIVHNVAKLFDPLSLPKASLDERLRRLNRLQAVVSRLWQTCAERRVIMAASCRPRPASRKRTPEPEGGQYLRHAANALVYLRRPQEGSRFIEASLLKHPSCPPRRITFTFEMGGVATGRITVPFRIRFEEELTGLRRDYREALKDPARREAFDSLVRALTGEMGAMSHVKVPTVLDVLLLAAAVEGQRSVDELGAQVKSISGRLERLEEALREALLLAQPRPAGPGAAEASR